MGLPFDLPLPFSFVDLHALYLLHILERQNTPQKVSHILRVASLVNLDM